MTAYTIILTALVVLYIAYRLYSFINDKDKNREQRKQMTSRINTLEAEAAELREVINNGIKESNNIANDATASIPGGSEVGSLDEL